MDTLSIKTKMLLKNQLVKKLKYNRDVQMIFQDAMSSLNPKKRIIDIISEPIINFENLSEEDTRNVFRTSKYCRYG